MVKIKIFRILQALKYKLRHSHNPHIKGSSEVFSKIYSTNYWGSDSSASGTGSEQIQTQKLIGLLQNCLDRRKINTFLDIPCGDFNWMKGVDFSGKKYIGADIVPDLITRNNQLYQKENISFSVIDLVNHKLPKMDMIFCRDCLVHLSYNDIRNALKSILDSGSTYLLTTSFPLTPINYDIKTGDWRALNFAIKPFNFPTPIEIFAEDSTEENGLFSDKSMYLWEIKSLAPFI